ncbi:hypothetical protein CGC21_2925 [Leishmania donovani]|uniref:Uncharacterized protein n=1 Tax=Leishmania donovani TaxID=5661 RepID=A0A504Y280_LEIDO|nr:hypothetical protein CGC21_2925 [Leishmania donovani]
MSSDAALDEKLTELLRVMVSRLPVNKTLPAAVVQKLLLAKYGDTYPEAYVASRSTFIGDTVDRTALKDQQEAATPSSAVSVAERCKAMAECLRKLSYHVRAPTAEESLEDYLREYLLVEFEKHGMDPDKYSKSDIKRYRIKREVELLQQDGASLSLDRRNRAGRGFSNLAVSKEAGGSGSQASPSPSAASARQTSMFLDDE